MRYLASYDLTSASSPHSEFLKQAEAYGLYPWIKDDLGRFYRLPNTTLTGQFTNKTAAAAALGNTLIATQQALGRPVNMPKYIVAEFANAEFQSDEQADR